VSDGEVRPEHAEAVEVGGLRPALEPDSGYEGRAARLVEPEEMVPPLLYVVSREADNVNGWRFDANLWDPSLPCAEAARRAGRPADFELHPRPG
jgi:hypothetical protein